MPSDESPSARGIALYAGGILVTIPAIILGVFLHWAAAMVGPGIGLFGIDAWVGAFIAVPLALLGIWAWRVGGQHIGSKTKLAGRFVAMAAFAAAVVGANHLLAASWSAVCSSERPELCYNLGTLVDSDADARTALLTACSTGYIQGCTRIVERFSDDSAVDRACESGLDHCEYAARCRGGRPDACAHFDDPDDLPVPDARQCSRLAEQCGQDLEARRDVVYHCAPEALSRRL